MIFSQIKKKKLLPYIARGSPRNQRLFTGVPRPGTFRLIPHAVTGRSEDQLVRGPGKLLSLSPLSLSSLCLSAAKQVARSSERRRLSDGEASLLSRSLFPSISLGPCLSLGRWRCLPAGERSSRSSSSGTAGESVRRSSLQSRVLSLCIVVASDGCLSGAGACVVRLRLWDTRRYCARLLFREYSAGAVDCLGGSWTPR